MFDCLFLKSCHIIHLELTNTILISSRVFSNICSLPYIVNYTLIFIVSCIYLNFAVFYFIGGKT